MMIERLLHSSKLLELHRALQAGQSVLIEELWNSPKALIASLAQQATGKNILILTGAGHEESKLFHDFPLFSERPVMEFPAWEAMPHENVAPSPDIVGERYQVLKGLVEDKSPRIILATLSACLQRLIQPARFHQLFLSLQVGQSLDFEAFIIQLQDMGYQRAPVASDKGEFAIRGGIIDVFPVSSPDPLRIEFWGDEISSIRLFDPIGQKSVQHVQKGEITAAKELELIGTEKELSTLLDYLGKDTIVVLDDLLALEDKWASIAGMLGKPNRNFCTLDQLFEQITPLQTLYWTHQPIEELSEVQLQRTSGYYSDAAPMGEVSFQSLDRKFHAQRWKNPFSPVAPTLLPHKEEGDTFSPDELLEAVSKLKDSTLIFLCSNDAEKTGLEKKLSDLYVQLPAKTDFHYGYLSSGFVLHDIELVLFPITEMTKRYKIRRQKLRSSYNTAPTEVYDLSPGEMVVHLNNGIGRFIGLEKKPNNLGIESEFFLLEYAENSKLYVPINQAHLLSKYIGANESTPKMHTLGGTRWKRAKEVTEQAILGYASELLQVYAKREVKGGFAYPEDSPDILSFEEEFPYSETEDQLNAVESIKNDMRTGKAMDRLVCGDVGYGKTEVAMRAAFKAVMDGGKQVAVLVPTTVLAMQHYENFLDRMRNFPVKVDVLSRFRSQKEIKETVENLAKGTVDIVIGTHRLISQDITFNNLGLVIIDEEQRFGVKAKEHLKKIKTGVDCLTLSATPIPRTLYMSLVGARDMSLINTPPQDRLPIKTVIAEPDPALFKNALLRELARDGQAYIIHNRVDSIYGMQDRIKELLPQARTGVVHGQMHADEIDSVFHAFKNGSIDILIATSIIESGIDMPNANTILIDRADRFGLSDLYQLRGRVGRWNRQAFAYFLIPKFHMLPELARKRLQALAEASGYGGGMKLAMRDLEIRGAGDILGTEQSGHVSAVGFHLYCKLLKRTIKTLEGKIPSILTEAKIDFPVDARLPEAYVNEVTLRMEIYQRLGDALTYEEVEEVSKELKDRFGPPPEPVLWLLHITRIKIYATLHGFTKLKMEKVTLIAERQKGKVPHITRHMIGKISSPQELETKVNAALAKAANTH